MSDTMTLTNQQIAERLGWTDVSEDRARVVFVDSVVLTGIPPSGGDIQVPDYLNSVDAALTLPLEPDMYYLLEVPGEDSGARCAIWNQHPRSTNRGRLREVEVAADTPAAAICAAWWAWMDNKED